jgi:hypothetical protein
MEDSPGVLKVSWLPDEAHFHLYGFTNKQNALFCTSENPWVTSCICNPPQPKRLRVQSSVSNAENISPVLMDDTVISGVYLSMLRAVCSVCHRTPSDF